MQSLRYRLLFALLLTISIGLGICLAWQTSYMSREETGFLDSRLRGIAHQVLHAMPSNLEGWSPDQQRASAADPIVMRENISWQVWVKNRAILRSLGSPLAPLKSDFTEGFADSQVGDVKWRVYAVASDNGEMQVQIGQTYDQISLELERWVYAGVLSSGLLLILLGGAIWLVIDRSLRPVTQVQTAIRDRKLLDPDPLPTAGLPTEVRPLVDSFNRLLERLDSALQGERRFIADAAHELRTPLAAILAYAHVALHADEPDKQRSAVLSITTCAERSARLSEQLLDLARLDAGTHVDANECVDLSELVVVVVNDFEHLAAQRQQRISLNIEPCSVLGQTDEIGILLRNLIDNAMRYSGVGGHIAISCRPIDASNRAVCLTVADDGPGVPGSERARIFDRFYRVAGSGERGSGIGLSLVARAAHRHGATIEVGDGLEGRGLGVSIRFPPAPDSDAQLPADSVRASLVPSNGGGKAAA